MIELFLLLCSFVLVSVISNRSYKRGLRDGANRQELQAQWEEAQEAIAKIDKILEENNKDKPTGLHIVKD